MSFSASDVFSPFSPSRWTVRAPLVIRLSPIVTVYCCCEGGSASLSSVFLPAVQWPVSSFTLALLLRRDLVIAAPKISDVFHTRALVKSSLCPTTLRGQRLVMARGGIAVQIAVRGCSHGGGSDNHLHKGSAGLLHCPETARWHRSLPLLLGRLSPDWYVLGAAGFPCNVVRLLTPGIRWP